MKVAQVAPLYESVPPQLYGGTERVVGYLTEELVRMGHDVTLFASGDSITQARLEPMCTESLRLNPGCIDSLAHHMLMIERVAQQASEFDIIHYHCDYLHYSISRRLGVPHVTTLHGRLDLPDLVPLYEEFSDIPVVSISDAQRGPLPRINWRGTVYHGLPYDLYHLHSAPGEYLAFVGRISPEKGIDRAIEIAIEAEVPLRIAAKVDRADEEYFQQKIKPLLQNSLVKFIGEISDAEKDDFLGNALATLLPIDWPEPFGLAMIESMACGTPVIAFNRGSVPEILEEGVSGVVVSDVQEAVASIERVRKLDRKSCRAAFERRFTVNRMANDYIRIYKELVARHNSESTLENSQWKTSSA